MIQHLRRGYSYNSKKTSPKTKGIRAAIIIVCIVFTFFLWWLFRELARYYSERQEMAKWTPEDPVPRHRAEDIELAQPARDPVTVNAPAATYRPFGDPIRSYEPPSAREYREAAAARLAEERRGDVEMPPPYAGLVPPPVYKEA